MRRILLVAAMALIGMASAGGAIRPVEGLPANSWQFVTGGSIGVMSAGTSSRGVLVTCTNCLNSGSQANALIFDGRSGSVQQSNTVPNAATIAAACTNDPAGGVWNFIAAGTFYAWNVSSGVAMTSPYAGYAPVQGSRCLSYGNLFVAMTSQQCKGGTGCVSTCSVLQEPLCTCPKTPACTSANLIPLATSFVVGSGMTGFTVVVSNTTVVTQMVTSPDGQLVAFGSQILSASTGLAFVTVNGTIAKLLSGTGQLAYALFQLSSGGWQLTCANLLTGVTLWSTAVPFVGAVMGDLVISDGMILVVSERAMAFNAVVGTLMWQTHVVGTLSAATVDTVSGTFVLAVDGTGLMALNAYTGATSWSVSASVSAAFAPQLTSGFVVAVSWAKDAVIGVPFNVVPPSPPAPQSVTQQLFDNFNCTGKPTQTVSYKTGCQPNFAVSTFVACAIVGGQPSVIFNQYSTTDCSASPTSTESYTLAQCYRNPQAGMNYIGC